MSRHILFIFSAVLAVQTNAFAATDMQKPDGRSPSAVREGDEDDEYNFSWLDPDKKVYVLQNRKYRKDGRFAVYLQGGLNLNNPYRSELLYGPRVSYWLNEQFGFDAFYYGINSGKNETYESLEEAATNSGALPFVRRHHSYFGAQFTWTPWYAKINFFNKILYFDWFLNLGAGQAATSVDRNRSKTTPANFVDENVFTIFFGMGQNYYITRNWVVRLDLIGSTYTASSINANTSKRFTNFDFTAGLGYVF